MQIAQSLNESNLRLSGSDKYLQYSLRFENPLILYIYIVFVLYFFQCGKVRTKFRASFRAQERQLLLTTPTIRRVVPVLDTSSAETVSFHVKPARKGKSSTKAPTPVRRHLPSSAELPAPDVQGSHVTQPSTPITRWAVLRWVLRCAWPAGSVLVCPAQRACFITERRRIVIIPITSCVVTTFLTSRGSPRNMCRLQPRIVNKDCLRRNIKHEVF